MKKIKNIVLIILIIPALFNMVGFVGLKDKKFNNVIIDGIDLTYMSYRQGLALIQENIKKELMKKKLVLEIGNEKMEFTYPEIDVKTDTLEVFDKAVDLGRKRYKTNFKINKEYYLKGAEEIVEGIRLNKNKQCQNADIDFKPENENKFIFIDEVNGYKLNEDSLLKDIDHSLNFGGVVKAKFEKTYAIITKEYLKKFTYLKSKFSTNYSSSSENRKHNIQLALSMFNGQILEKNEILSFNKTTGVRSEENGYRTAKIIKDGKYIDGLGGGVCQASTTLYNTAILAGLEIVEQHNHSLAVGYVEPSFDAMVNISTSDLIIRNNTKGKIFIKTYCDEKSAYVEIYGEQNEYEIRRESKVTELISPEKIQIVYDDNNYFADLLEGQSRVLIEENNGLKSEGYLIYLKNGKVAKKKLIRKDKYDAKRGLVVIKRNTIKK